MLVIFYLVGSTDARAAERVPSSNQAQLYLTSVKSTHRDHRAPIRPQVRTRIRGRKGSGPMRRAAVTGLAALVSHAECCCSCHVSGTRGLHSVQFLPASILDHQHAFSMPFSASRAHARLTSRAE